MDVLSTASTVSRVLHEREAIGGGLGREVLGSVGECLDRSLGVRLSTKACHEGDTLRLGDPYVVEYPRDTVSHERIALWSLRGASWVRDSRLWRLRSSGADASLPFPTGSPLAQC